MQYLSKSQLPLAGVEEGEAKMICDVRGRFFFEKGNVNVVDVKGTICWRGPLLRQH